MAVLDIKKVEKELRDLKNWFLKDNKISKEYTFPSYMNSIQFINKLAVEAEKNNHHPDMVVGWCNIKITLTSHDEGGVTDKCLIMAKSAEKVFLA